MSDDAPLSVLLVQVTALATQVGKMEATQDGMAQQVMLIVERLDRGDAKFDALEAARVAAQTARATAAAERTGIVKTLTMLGTLTMAALTTIGALVYQYGADIIAFVRLLLSSKTGPS